MEDPLDWEQPTDEDDGLWHSGTQPACPSEAWYSFPLPLDDDCSSSEGGAPTIQRLADPTERQQRFYPFSKERRDLDFIQDRVSNEMWESGLSSRLIERVSCSGLRYGNIRPAVFVYRGQLIIATTRPAPRGRARPSQVRCAEVVERLKDELRSILDAHGLDHIQLRVRYDSRNALLWSILEKGPYKRHDRLKRLVRARNN